MPTFGLSKEDCGTLMFWLNGCDLTKVTVVLGSTAVADNAALVQALVHLRDTLGKALNNTFDATIALSILNQAATGTVGYQEEAERLHARRLLECGYLVGRGPDNHGTMYITGLHESGRPLRDFLEWWSDRP